MLDTECTGSLITEEAAQRIPTIERENHQEFMGFRALLNILTSFSFVVSSASYTVGLTSGH